MFAQQSNGISQLLSLCDASFNFDKLLNDPDECVKSFKVIESGSEGRGSKEKKKEHYRTDDSDTDVEDTILADLKEKWKTVEGNGRITDDATLSDILEVDAELLTASYPTDEEILKSLMDNNKGQENDSYSENEHVIQPKPHRTEMLQSFETIKRFRNGRKCSRLYF
ncbi:hypothetical protein AVEN_211919-1 [Araneus ventricosus]|uniref:Uncharacterized protein n=1 Tax=Araneus ventricosus TaxID=182803 RepID=A0A4Y2JGC0_ARAVE|nr:hypothetical protein AVEN_211919-1 [Araneus ventricosus]